MDAGNEGARNGTQHRRRSGGPHPGILAAVSLALFLAALLCSALLPGGRSSLLSPLGQMPTADGGAGVAATVAGMLLFGAAVPLGIYTAAAYARQLKLGIRVPGPAISFFGGIAASLMLMGSGLFTWLLGRPEVIADPALVHGVAFLAYLSGGVGFVTGAGLLVAGLAVPGLILGFLPRWLAWVGLVIAALSELSFLSLAVAPLQFLLPVGRFGALPWLIAVGFLLPLNRAAANRPPADWSPRRAGTDRGGLS